MTQKLFPFAALLLALGCSGTKDVVPPTESDTTSPDADGDTDADTDADTDTAHTGPTGGTGG